MANSPDSSVLLARALDVCSCIVNLEFGPSVLQGEARELMWLLAQFEPFIPEPGTLCGCGSGAIRLRNGRGLCYSCWMVGPRQENTAGAANEPALTFHRMNLSKKCS
jgi:hypothetical protein